MFRPSSAMRICAARGPMPGTSSRRSTVLARRRGRGRRDVAGPSGPTTGGGLGSGSSATRPSMRAVSRSTLSVQRVDLVQQELGEVGVVVIEPAVEGLDERGFAWRELAPGQVGEDLRVAFTGDERFDHRPCRHPEQVCRHRRQLDQGVFEQLLEALLVPGPFLDQLGPQSGVVPQRRISAGGTKLGRSMPRSQSLASHTASSLSVLGRPGDLLHVAGVDQPAPTARDASSR